MSTILSPNCLSCSSRNNLWGWASKLFKEQSRRCWAHRVHVPPSSGLLPNTAPGAGPEQKYLCGWSTSGVLLEPVLWLTSPRRNPGTALQGAPEQGVEESLEQTASNPAAHSVWNTQVHVPQVVLVLLFLIFGDGANLNCFLFYGSLES